MRISRPWIRGVSRTVIMQLLELRNYRSLIMHGKSFLQFRALLKMFSKQNIFFVFYYVNNKDI